MKAGQSRRRSAVLASLALLTALLLTPPAAGGATGVAVEGSDTARLAAPAGSAPSETPPSCANAGYRLEWGSDGGVVEVDLSPLASAAPFAPPPASPEPGPVERTARRAVEGAATRYEAVSALLGWMVRNTASAETVARVPAEGATAEPSAASETPEAVLARGSASAGGLARLAVALLSAVGIEARPVEGWVVGAPHVGAPHGAHTWIEVRMPDRGWVFSDPLYHHHYVPATYLPAACLPPSGADTGPVPPRIEERRDRRETVDLYPAGGPGVTARKNSPRQVASALRVVVAAPVAGETRGSAVLDGPGGRVSKVLVGGESVFVGLAGGDYRLEVYLEGRPPLVRRVAVAPRQRSAVFLRGDRRSAWSEGGGGAASDADD